MQRRDKIARAYLPALNPSVDARLEISGAGGELYFDNAAVRADAAPSPGGYHATWYQFDNGTGLTRLIGERSGTSMALAAPGALPASPGDFVQIDVAADAAAPAAWQKPVRLFFRRGATGWTLVGLDRGAR
jgi:hypothetical protein